MSGTRYEGEEQDKIRRSLNARHGVVTSLTIRRESGVWGK